MHRLTVRLEMEIVSTGLSGLDLDEIEAAYMSAVDECLTQFDDMVLNELPEGAEVESTWVLPECRLVAVRMRKP